MYISQLTQEFFPLRSLFLCSPSVLFIAYFAELLAMDLFSLSLKEHNGA